MSLAAYPASLPLPLLSGYGLKRADNFLRSGDQTGRPSQRRRFRRVPTELSASFRLKPTEAQQLEAFVRNTLHDGAAWFLLDVLTPAGLLQHRVRFITDPREDCQPNGSALWDYRARIEVRELQTLGEEAVATALTAPNSVEQLVQGVDGAVDSYQD